ncbi:MAG: flagellar filament capping protein FliD [Negativicutes bacterium]|nr:flagellar filament capping protein FliD [Negativicutes bacterium]
MATSTTGTSGNLSLVSSPALGTSHMNGMVSGLDIDSLVSATIQADSIPMTLLQNKNALLQAQMNDYNSIKTSLYSLESSATDLTYSSTFSARTTTTSDSTKVTATALNGSASGSYTVNVSTLATTTYNTGSALTMSTGTYATMTGSDISGSNPNTALGIAGSITVNNQAIAVTNTDTINTILNKISASSAGVTATLSGGKVTLTQKTIGATPTITMTDSNGILASLGLSTSSALTAGTNADEGVAFNQLAASNPLSGVTGGYFSINGTYISVDPTTDTLDSIVNKINNSSAGVMAFYDSTNKTISLTSKKAGAQDITLGTGSTDTSNFLTQAGLVQTNQVKGQDAAVKINGVNVTAVNNTVTLNGNTFTLAGTGTATVTVQTDTDSIIKKVQDFITQYNATIDLINGKMNEQTNSSSSDLSVGDLFGDSTLEQASMDLRSFSYAVVSSQPSSMQQLSQAGITTGAVGQGVAASETGHLSLDTTVLTAALQSDPNAVAALFGNSMAAVSGETPTGTVDGTNTSFQLANSSITGSPTITVNGVTYNQVAGTPKADDYTTDPANPKIYNQYSIDYTTGKITFGTAPISGATITASYNYDVSSGTNAGVFVQMSTLLDNYTQVGGTFDAITGSNGSVTNQISYNNDRIKDMQDSLQTEQASLYAQYQDMESQLENLKSQQNFLTSQLASLPSWK